LTAYRVENSEDGPQHTPIRANDAGVSTVNAAPDGGTAVSISPMPSGNPSGGSDTGGFTVGQYGLGQMFTGAGGPVRPFRRLITVQSLFRREVFAQ
jgi:hypothetical protein